MNDAIVQGVREGRVIAIMRGFEPETCLRLAQAYAEGGIRMVEVTYRQNAPETWKDTVRAIRTIREHFAGVLAVGAGTVLTSEQLAMTRDAGGVFMVAPNVNAELIRECVREGLSAIPGALTPTEAVVAHDAGAAFVKLFPAGNLGTAYVKSLCTPLAHIPFLAVGGITPANVADFMRAGCVGAGVSGSLTNREWIAAGEWGRITDVARELVAKCREGAEA